MATHMIHQLSSIELWTGKKIEKKKKKAFQNFKIILEVIFQIDSYNILDPS